LIDRHVFTAERLQGDDTSVPILAKGRTVTGGCEFMSAMTGRFGGRDPSAALFY
jgi:transposase